VPALFAELQPAIPVVVLAGRDRECLGDPTRRAFPLAFIWSGARN
jgi:hypothetical protein